MKRRGKILTTLSILAALCLAPLIESCGTMHSYWGVENDYYENFDGHGGHYKRHKRPKPPKHKHKKYYKHHHHDDDDDDD